jgi:hypothetical protein
MTGDASEVVVQRGPTRAALGRVGNRSCEIERRTGRLRRAEAPHDADEAEDLLRRQQVAEVWHRRARHSLGDGVRQVRIGRRRSGRDAHDLEAPGGEVARALAIQCQRDGRGSAAVTARAMAAGAPVLVA